LVRKTQRRLLIAIAVATLVAWVLTVVDLAIGGRPDPPMLRASATLLDGAWRFRAGDDPRWATAGIDDSRWESIDMTAPPGSHDGDVGLPDYVGGWMARGHPGYRGYGWYRRVVAVPGASARWDLLGPTLVEDAYEIYWNGTLLGGSGRLGSHPRAVGTRPLRFALPDDAAGTRGVLAIRAYMLPGSGASPEGGGMHTAPILAPRPTGAALHRAQWQRTIAGYVVDAVEPIAMFAVIALALGCWSGGGQKAFLGFACLALALTAARRLNNAIVSWTDLQSLTTYSFLASVMWVPTVAAWLLAWNRWCGRAWRSIDLAAIALAVVGTVAALLDSTAWIGACRYGSMIAFAVVAARIIRGGPQRWLALATLASILAALFGGELLDPLGVPGIWFPFGIGVSRTQYIYAVAIPLLAFLIVRSVDTQGQPGLKAGGAAPE